MNVQALGLKNQVCPTRLIETNKELEEKEQSRLLAEASKIVAAKLNKPEKYVMVAWTAVPKMIFDNDPNGAAFLELQSIGIPEASRQELAAALAKCAAQFLGTDADRVYLVMKDIPANNNGKANRRSASPALFFATSPSNVNKEKLSADYADFVPTAS